MSEYSNEELTPLERENFGKLIESFPSDGTDWDGIHDAVARKMLHDNQKLEKIKELHKTEFNAARLWKKLRVILELK